MKTSASTDTHDMLASITQRIHTGFAYVSREAMRIQAPLTTLKLASGSCRDFAMLMIEAVRCLGLAAPFRIRLHLCPARTGAAVPGGGPRTPGCRSTCPAPGWVEFDPTNGIVGNRDLVRVAVARDPSQAVPLYGTWAGCPSTTSGWMSTLEVIAGDARRDRGPRPMSLRRDRPGDTSCALDAGYEIAYECPQPTPMLLVLSVHPSRVPDLIDARTRIAFDPAHSR